MLHMQHCTKLLTNIADAYMNRNTPNSISMVLLRYYKIWTRKIIYPCTSTISQCGRYEKAIDLARILQFLIYKRQAMFHILPSWGSFTYDTVHLNRLFFYITKCQIEVIKQFLQIKTPKI